MYIITYIIFFYSIELIHSYIHAITYTQDCSIESIYVCMYTYEKYSVLDKIQLFLLTI